MNALLVKYDYDTLHLPLSFKQEQQTIHKSAQTKFDYLVCLLQTCTLSRLFIHSHLQIWWREEEKTPPIMLSNNCSSLVMMQWVNKQCSFQLKIQTKHNNNWNDNNRFTSVKGISALLFSQSVHCKAKQQHWCVERKWNLQMQTRGMQYSKRIWQAKCCQVSTKQKKHYITQYTSPPNCLTITVININQSTSF